MFEVYNIDGKRYETVYGVKMNNNREALFLIYWDGEWVWNHSQHYKPFHGDTK